MPPSTTPRRWRHRWHLLSDLRFEPWRGRTATGLHYIDLARPSPPDALVNESESSHIVGSINIAQIDDDGVRHFTLQTFQIECAELRPFRYNHQRIRAAYAGIGIVAIFDVGQFSACLLHADRIVRADFCAHVEQAGHQWNRWCLAHVVGVGLEGETE